MLVVRGEDKIDSGSILTQGHTLLYHPQLKRQAHLTQLNPAAAILSNMSDQRSVEGCLKGWNSAQKRNCLFPAMTNEYLSHWIALEVEFAGDEKRDCEVMVS